MVAAAVVVVAVTFGGVRWFATSDRIAETNVATETIDRPTPPDDAASFASDAARLSEDFAFVEEGTYRVDTLGTPFSFRTEGPLFVRPYSDGVIVFSHPTSSGSDDRDLALMRLSALSDATRLDEPFDGLDDGWAPDDIDGWLDALPDGVAVSGRTATTLGGLDATRFDLAVGEASCEPNEEWCVGFGTNRLTYSKSLKAGATYRIWFVEQGDEEPLAVIAGIEGPADSGWFDTVEDIASSLGFGSIAPNPIASVPAGQAELPLLGGIRIELREETVVSQVLEGFGRVPLGTQLADTTFISNPRLPGGEILGTSDELVALVRERGSAMAELASTTVGGIDARVFEVVGDNLYRPAVLRTADDLAGWFPPRTRPSVAGRSPRPRSADDRGPSVRQRRGDLHVRSGSNRGDARLTGVRRPGLRLVLSPIRAGPLAVCRRGTSRRLDGEVARWPPITKRLRVPTMATAATPSGNRTGTAT